MEKLKDEHIKNPKRGYFAPVKSAQELLDEAEDASPCRFLQNPNYCSNRNNTEGIKGKKRLCVHCNAQ